MSLFNKKANQDDHIDRISELPSNVIDGILEKLNICDLVRTSILSTKWRNMWTYVPRLEFGEEFFLMHGFPNDPVPDPDVSKIVTDVLMLHNGPIYKFTLVIPYEFRFEITLEHLNTWIPFLSKRGIKDLELENYGIFLEKMPHIVFSCEELTYITFSGFILSIPPNFSGFKRLLNLNLECVTFQSSALESLISGSPPLLEKLSIEYCDGFEHFHISAPSLKVLLLKFDHNMKSICLKKAKKLIDLTIFADNSKSCDYVETPQVSDHSEKLECISCCLKLQTVKIFVRSTSQSQRAMNLIQFILANSASLKTLTFGVGLDSKKLNAPMLLRMSQQLLWMERASQRAHVKFLHGDLQQNKRRVASLWEE